MTLPIVLTLHLRAGTRLTRWLATLCIAGSALAASSDSCAAETDAHNAEFCEPLFERAQAEADRTRPLRGAEKPSASAEWRETSQRLESMWRDAITQCRGISRRVAARYANELAYARGTQAPPAAAGEFTRNNMHFKGSFVADGGGLTYTGTGRIEWANGDVF